MNPPEHPRPDREEPHRTRVLPAELQISATRPSRANRRRSGYTGAEGGGRVSFGRVIKCTINPITVVNGIQPNTVTNVALGEFLRLASRIIQMARKIHTPIQINQKSRKP